MLDRYLFTAPPEPGSTDLTVLAENLLSVWCDGLLAYQIDDPSNPFRDGALDCPACSRLHGRSWEAIYPLLGQARTAGDERYVRAAVKLFDWSRHVTRPNGAWANDVDPTSWQGTTIFGAIAVAEALHHHAELLGDAEAARWRARLKRAANGYLWTDFVALDFTNVNYGFTAVYGFDLLGRVLGEDKFVKRATQLASEIKNFLTTPNALIYGEGKPADKVSGRGFFPVDLGYNVEESLNGAVLFALGRNDEELLSLLQRSMEGHLLFMLEDGAWDNSWGTRQFKWTYWGSRTSDGCQPAYALMAGRNPAFWTAAQRNVELLAACTSGGLLHGGPHYVSHGVKPCIHHTFAHAKALAFIRDNSSALPSGLDSTTPLPRQIADGVHHFSELDVWLAARGPWRATVSAYDSIYRAGEDPDHILHATGGSLALLHHAKLGPLFAASMPKYIQVEPLNQQDNPVSGFCLTPRIEMWTDGAWHTNLYDLSAQVTWSDDGRTVAFLSRAILQDENHVASMPEPEVSLEYMISEANVTVSAEWTSGDPTRQASLVLPVISSSSDCIRRVSACEIEIVKNGKILVVEATHEIALPIGESDRAFNVVPGFEALPLLIAMPVLGDGGVTCTMSMRN